MAGIGTKIEAKDGLDNQEEDQPMMSTAPLQKSAGMLFCAPQMIDNNVHSKTHHIDTGHACPAQKEPKLGRRLSYMREEYRNQV